jgi:hypothetical protein
MFNSLTINHFWIGALGIVDLDSSGAVNFFNDIWPFPFREELSYKEP